MTPEEKPPIRDSFTSQAGGAGAGDPLVGSDGAARNAGALPFPHTQVRPYGRCMGAARAIGAGNPHGGLDVPALLGSPARPGDDSRAAWSEVGSRGDRHDIMLSLGRSRRDYSSGLYERGRALRADSLVLVDSTTTLQANSRMLRANSRDLRAHSRTLLAAAVALCRPARAFPGQVERGGARAFREQVVPGRERAFPEKVPRGAWAIPKQRPPGDGRLSPERPGREHIQRSASASNIEDSSTTLHTPSAPEAIVAPRTYVSAGLEDAEVPLLGGDMTEGVVRVGRTVRRPVRPHTAAVHGLLRHLEAAGFDGAPRVLGTDAKNREVLTYLPGVVARRPLPAFATADSTLAALARLQLRYHEALADFRPAPAARWDGEVTRFVDGPVDIICHCDINLENVIFQPGPDGLRPYALIDFDLARPGTRLVDIIQTLRYWAPIADPADRDPALRDVDVAARIAIFSEAYGLSCSERARLVPVASRWLRRSRATIAQRARMRGGAWTRMVDVGVGERFLRSAVWLERHQPEIDARLRRPIRPQPASRPAPASQPARPSQPSRPSE